MTRNERLQITAETLAKKLGVSPKHALPILKRVLADLLRAELDNGKSTRSSRGDRERAPGSYVSVPYMSKAADSLPLQRCIAFVASSHGISHYVVAILMTYFLQAIATEVCMGNVVRIPGFGIFGPYLRTSDQTGAQTVMPRFVASRGFRQQTKADCDPNDAKNHELDVYQRSHHPSSRPDKSASSTESAMSALRSVWFAEAPHPSLLWLND